MNLEDDPSSEDVINQIFRFVHNLKGTSRAVGFREVAEFTHELENLILKVKNKEMVPGTEVVSLLLRCNDHIAGMVNGLKESLDAPFESQPLIAEIKAMIESGGQASADQAEQPTSDKEDVAQPDAEVLVTSEVPATDVSSINAAESGQAASSQPEQKWDNDQTKKPKAKPKAKAKAEEEYLRVALKKIEELNNFVGE